MASDETARDGWYSRLADLVETQQSSGKSTRSAGLKPVLQAHGFDEKALGFPSFRAFLVAAEDAGVVRLQQAEVGPDVDVITLDGPITESTPTSERRDRVRHDVWRAFVDWSTQWTRVYDRDLDSVGWFLTRAEPNERSEYAALRAAASAQPERFIPIVAASQQVTLRWISDFIASCQDNEQEALTASLSDPLPIRAFIQQAQALGLYGRWTNEHAKRVRELIDSWAADNALQLDLQSDRPEITSGPNRRQAARPKTPSTESLDSLRELVCSAIRQMSEAELLRLAIPLEYVLGDRAR